MSKSGIYGDNLTLLGAALLFNVQIIVISSLGKNATTIISSNGRFVSNLTTLYLGHYADKQFNELCHYVSLVPFSDFNLESFLLDCKIELVDCLARRHDIYQLHRSIDSVNPADNVTCENKNSTLVDINMQTSLLTKNRSTENTTNKIDDVRLQPFQPCNIVFPASVFGSKKRRFRAEWFKKYPWLEWDLESKAAFCHRCRMASKLGMITFSHSQEEAFTVTGYTNWKHATDKFAAHEHSNCHKEAVYKWSNYISTQNISCQLSQQIKNDQTINRVYLMVLFSTLRYLAKQGLAIRGHTDENSNYYKLLELRSNECTVLKDVLSSEKGKNWLSHDIQVEMLRCIAHVLLRQIADDIRSHRYFAIIVDETTDISHKEQVSICIRHVNENFQIHEDFIGLYATACTDAEALSKIIKDALLRMNLSLQNLRGQCYDGASNMSGVNTGVQRRIKDEQPKALYIHCRNHCLNLALQDASSIVHTVRDALSLTNDIANYFRESAKRSGILETTLQELSSSGSQYQLQPLCPTRWTVRTKSLNALREDYEGVCNALEELSNEPGTTGAKAAGFHSKLLTFEIYFAISISHKVFSITEQLATYLQDKHMTVGLRPLHKRMYVRKVKNSITIITRVLNDKIRFERRSSVVSLY